VHIITTLYTYSRQCTHTHETVHILTTIYTYSRNCTHTHDNVHILTTMYTYSRQSTQNKQITINIYNSSKVLYLLTATPKSSTFLDKIIQVFKARNKRWKGRRSLHIILGQWSSWSLFLPPFWVFSFFHRSGNDVEPVREKSRTKLT
jgi:hypothetical protein